MPFSNPPVLAIRSSVRVPRLLVAMPDPLECRECVVEVYCVAFLLILVQHEVSRRVLFSGSILHPGSRSHKGHELRRVRFHAHAEIQGSTLRDVLPPL